MLPFAGPSKVTLLGLGPLEEGEIVLSPVVLFQAHTDAQFADYAAPGNGHLPTKEDGRRVDVRTSGPGRQSTTPRLWAEVAKGPEIVRRPALSVEFLEGKVKISFPDGDEGEPVVTIDKVVIDTLAVA
ncbi:hypothetical protein V2J09_006397 [Rumex salicifolius]